MAIAVGSTPVVLQSLEPLARLMWSPRSDQALVIWETSVEGGTTLEWLDIGAGRSHHIADNVWSATWESSKERITYIQQQETGLGLWSSDLQGRKATQLTSLNLVAPDDIEWSPKEDHLLVQSDFGVAVFTWEQKTLTQTLWLAQAQDAAWLPDGQSILFQRATEDGQALWWVDITTAEEQVLLPQVLSAAHWLPDGTIVYMTPSAEDGAVLWQLDPRTGISTLLADAAVLLWRPVEDFVVSPLGNALAYQAQDGQLWLIVWEK